MSPEIETQVRDLIRQGRKIEAIKVYRGATGLGLAESKRDVEAIEAGRRPATAVGVGAGVVRDLLDQGRKIEAIKAYREATGSGLAESKEAVESLMRESGIVVEGGGGPAWIVAAIVSAAVALLVLWLVWGR